jgi:hypothetical protein
MDVLMRGLEDVLVLLGKVPSELVYDRMKLGIPECERARSRRLLENPTLCSLPPIAAS